VIDDPSKDLKIRFDNYVVWTFRGFYDTITWADYSDSFPQVNNEWVSASLRNTPTQLYEAGHGTFIELHLRPERTINSDIVQRELSRTYAPGLRHGKALKWLTISRVRDSLRTLQGEPFDLPDDPKKIVEFNLNVRYHEKLLPVTGTVALVEGLPYKDSFVSVGFGARVIFQTRACYESADGQRKYGGAGVAGWLDLGEGWQDFLTTTKEDIRDDVLRAALMHHVFEKIEPLLKETEEDRLSIVLEGISLDLTMAFNNLSDLDIADTESEEEVPAVIRVVYPSLSDNPKPFVAIEADPKVVEMKTVKKPPQSRIKLEPVSDEAMDGALCRLQILSEHETDLRVEINKDHEVVTELLKARPINKMGLNLMVTREIAASLCDHPQILKRALAPKVLNKLEQFSDNGDRERAFARLLMDSAVRPNMSEAA
jgi:hypothetical protein